MPRIKKGVPIPKPKKSDSDSKKLKSKETYEFTWDAEITPFYANLAQDDNIEESIICKLSSSKFLAGLSAGSLSEWHLCLVLNHQTQNLDLSVNLDRIFNSTSTDPNFKSSRSSTAAAAADKEVKVKINFGLQAKLLNLKKRPFKNAGFPDITLGSSKEIPEENHFELPNFISWKSLLRPQNKLIKISKVKDQSQQKHIKIRVILDFYGLVIENNNNNNSRSPDLKVVQQNQLLVVDHQFKQEVEIGDFGHNSNWEASFLQEELEKPADIFIRSSEGKIYPVHSSIIKARAPLFALDIMKRNWSSENGPSDNQDEVASKQPLKTQHLSTGQNNQNHQDKDRPMDVDMDNKSLDSFLHIVYQTSTGGQENTQAIKFKVREEKKSTSSRSSLNSIEGHSGTNLMKIACINQMVRQISVENAALILHLCRCGHTFEPYNMEIIGNFCFDNSEQIMASQAYKDHFGNNQKAFSDLYISLLTEDQVHKKLEESLRNLDLF